MSPATRLLRGLSAVLVPVIALSGCGMIGGGTSGGHDITAYFPSAIGLYKTGNVLVLDHPIGTITNVVLEDTRVRVDMHIRDDVPLPADVHATIEATTVLGERSITLFPSWSPQLEAASTPRLQDHAVIPIERTSVPVEPDDGLKAFNQLVSSLDPQLVGSLVTDSATILDGRGKVIGSAIDSASSLSETLAAVDEPMLAAARSFNQIAGTLNARGDQLRALIDDFGTAVHDLATQRDAEQRLLAGLVGLTDQTSSILDVHGQQLPTTIATLVATTQVMAANAQTFDTLLNVFPTVADSFQRAYSPDLGGFLLKVNTEAVLDTVVTQLLQQLHIVPGSP